MRKKYFLILPIFLLAIPWFAFAHGMAGFSDVKSGVDMMRYVEDMGMGGGLHEEMETLMMKMMTGSLTEQEANRISEITKQYPGPSGMMTGRMMRSFGDDSSKSLNEKGRDYNMMRWSNWDMGWGWFGFWAFAGMLGILVWLIVGVLAAVWLWRQISKKPIA